MHWDTVFPPNIFYYSSGCILRDILMVWCKPRTVLSIVELLTGFLPGLLRVNIKKKSTAWWCHHHVWLWEYGLHLGQHFIQDMSGMPCGLNYGMCSVLFFIRGIKIKGPEYKCTTNFSDIYLEKIMEAIYSFPFTITAHLASILTLFFSFFCT